LKKYLPFLAIAIFFALSQLCYANPIVVDDPSVISQRKWLVGAFSLMLACTVVVESVIIAMELRRHLGFGKSALKLYAAVILINVITFTATQAIALGLVIVFDSQNAGYIAEVFPLVAEYFMLKWTFAKLYQSGIFIKPVSARKTLVLTLIANIVTFAGGFVGLVFLYENIYGLLT